MVTMGESFPLSCLPLSLCLNKVILADLLYIERTGFHTNVSMVCMVFFYLQMLKLTIVYILTIWELRARNQTLEFQVKSRTLSTNNTNEENMPKLKSR